MFATIILNGILFGMLLSILIGPVFFVLLETSIKKGARHAIFIDIGVLLSDVLYLIAAFFFSEKINESIKIPKGFDNKAAMVNFIKEEAKNYKAKKPIDSLYGKRSSSNRQRKSRTRTSCHPGVI